MEDEVGEVGGVGPVAGGEPAGHGGVAVVMLLGVWMDVCRRVDWEVFRGVCVVGGLKERRKNG